MGEWAGLRCFLWEVALLCLRVFCNDWIGQNCSVYERRGGFSDFFGIVLGIELILAFMNQEVMCCTCVYTNLER